MGGLFDGFEGHRVPADDDLARALTTALVAVDANVLLNLYRYNVSTADDLMTVFERLGDRLVVPHQAIREFHRNRLSAIGNPDTSVQNVHSALEKNQRSTIDALAQWAKQVALPDDELARLRTSVTTVYGELLAEVGKAAPDRVRADTPAVHDRVLKRLAGLLEGKVLPQVPDEEWTALVTEGRRRAEEQPGRSDR